MAASSGVCGLGARHFEQRQAATSTSTATATATARATPAATAKATATTTTRATVPRAAAALRRDTSKLAVIGEPLAASSRLAASGGCGGGSAARKFYTRRLGAPTPAPAHTPRAQIGPYRARKSARAAGAQLSSLSRQASPRQHSFMGGSLRGCGQRHRDRHRGRGRLRPTAGALVFQIVIISLILHKSPPAACYRTSGARAVASLHSPALATTSATTAPTPTTTTTTTTTTGVLSGQRAQWQWQPIERRRLNAGNSAREGDNAARQRRALQLEQLKWALGRPKTGGGGGDGGGSRRLREQTKRAPRDEHEGRPNIDAQWPAQGRRLRRHLAGAGPSASAAAPAVATAAPPAKVECHRLAALWLYLRSSYPSLAGHLLEWANQAPGKQSDEQFLWARSAQVARSLGHLLSEAERLIAATTAGGGGASGPSALSASAGPGDRERQRQLAGAAWLARVSSSPAYARLVQHLRAKQQQQQQQQLKAHHQAQQWAAAAHEAATTTAASAAAAATEDEGRWAAQVAAAADGSAAGGELMAGAASGPDAAYGRLVQYPHEIGSTDNSRGMARTLDKLRLLNQHNRQQQQLDELQQSQQSQQSQQQQHQSQRQGGDRDIEETNRIPLAGDVEQMTESDWRRFSESASDAARQNIVYGKVLLGPSRAQPDEPHPGPHQARARPHHGQRQQRPLAILQGVQHEQERQRALALERQPPPSGEQGELAGAAHDKSRHAAASGSSGGGSSSSSERLQQHQAQGQSLSGTAPADSTGGAGGLDEMASQQQFQEAAVSETPGEGSGGGGSNDAGDEFDSGDFFHDGPLNKPEVRLLRSPGRHYQSQQQQQQQPQPQPQPQPQQPHEPVDGGLNFVID